MPRTSETHSIDSRTYTRMKFGPVFILGVVGGNSSANSSWDHFRIYGMLDRKVYKRKKLSCCLLYRGINGFVTVKTDTMRQRFHEVPAAMWNFHVSCSNVKSAQGKHTKIFYLFLPSVLLHLSRDARKPVFGVSDQVRHKPTCTSSEKS